MLSLLLLQMLLQFAGAVLDDGAALVLVLCAAALLSGFQLPPFWITSDFPVGS